MSLRRIRTAVLVAAVGLLGFAAASLADDRFYEIDRAEGALHAALEDLHRARHGFGGHREHAVRLIEEALHQLREAKEFAREHGR